MPFSASPAINVTEIDISGSIRRSPSTTGAFAGNFNWGVANEAILVSDETDLAVKFGSPNRSNSSDFHIASSFLKYTRNLQVVRAIDETASTKSFSLGGLETGNLDGKTFNAKYYGLLGNNLKVEVCQANKAVFDSWDYKSFFTSEPATSKFATENSYLNDEIHVVVIDATGGFSGTPNTVLETYSFVSILDNAKLENGSGNFVKNVIRDQSNYIEMGLFDEKINARIEAGLADAKTTPFDLTDGLDNDGDNSNIVGTFSYTLTGAVAETSTNATKILDSYQEFSDVEGRTIDFLIAPELSDSASAKQMVDGLTLIAETRKDCIVVTSPPRDAVVKNPTPASSIVDAVDAFTNSSYLFVDGNFLNIYDKYNDETISIPACGATAGLMAATDTNFAPWFSPAGVKRGRYFGVTSLVWTPNKQDRDVLYKASVNPIANIAGQGILLYGDKTKLNRPSAFDRVNVRRLFLVIERAVATYARTVLFELNNDFTRTEFVNLVNPFLREIAGRGGITEFRVIANDTNNPPQTIDENLFRADIFIKPTKSINFIQLNFIGTRSGVELAEIADSANI